MGCFLVEAAVDSRAKIQVTNRYFDGHKWVNGNLVTQMTNVLFEPLPTFVWLALRAKKKSITSLLNMTFRT